MDKRKAEFVKIIDQHKGIIFKICNSYCNDREDQKDLAQDIIIELWKSFDKYNSQYKLSTWIYRIALNVAISYYRRSLTKKKHLTSLDLDLVHIAAPENIEKEEDMEMLLRFVNQLDEMNKALIILYLEGNSHKEIGEILDISTSNVGTKIGRIKQKLKNYFLKKSN